MGPWTDNPALREEVLEKKQPSARSSAFAELVEGGMHTAADQVDYRMKIGEG